MNYKQLKEDVDKIKLNLESPELMIIENDSDKIINFNFKNIEFEIWTENNRLYFKILNQNQKFIRKADEDEILIYQAKNKMEVKSDYHIIIGNNIIYLMGSNKDDTFQDWYIYFYEYLENLLVAIDDWNMNCPLLKEEDHDNNKNNEEIYFASPLENQLINELNEWKTKYNQLEEANNYNLNLIKELSQSISENNLIQIKLIKQNETKDKIIDRYNLLYNNLIESNKLEQELSFLENELKGLDNE